MTYGILQLHEVEKTKPMPKVAPVSYPLRIVKEINLGDHHILYEFFVSP
jgi:hypothetical protein